MSDIQKILDTANDYVSISIARKRANNKTEYVVNIHSYESYELLPGTFESNEPITGICSNGKHYVCTGNDLELLLKEGLAKTQASAYKG